LGICHLVLLVPVLGLLEHPYYPNDRYSLLVSVCWSALFASLLANPKLHRFWRAVILTVAIASIMTLGVLSFRQTRIWKNGVVLFEHMLKTLGDDPYRGDIYWRFGKLLSKQGRLDYAIECFEKTLEIEPQHPWAHHYLAYTLVQKGEVQQAITHYMKAVRVKPDLAEAHQNLGVVLLMQNSLGKAVSHFYRALDSKPDYLMPLESLERILAKYPESNHCDVDKVIKYAERAAESTGYGNARILKVLAAAYAASERFYKAMETAEKAVELASAAGDKELATEIRSQIQFYQKGKPYWRN
jgi:tetratricopeptide (TPR) repeat protein